MSNVRYCLTRSDDGESLCILQSQHTGEHHYGTESQQLRRQQLARTYAEDDVSVDFQPEAEEELPLDVWWQNTAADDFLGFGPKLAEYGARDLIHHGRAIWEMRGGEETGDRVLGEIGCLFYLHGKLARALEAYVEGRLPSEDTLKDITVYSLMARAFRERGELR